MFTCIRCIVFRHLITKFEDPPSKKTSFRMMLNNSFEIQKIDDWFHISPIWIRPERYFPAMF
jgi:hypothetical protein